MVDLRDVLTIDTTICTLRYYIVSNTVQRFCSERYHLANLECQACQMIKQEVRLFQCNNSKLQRQYSEGDLEDMILPLYNILSVGLSVVKKIVHYWWNTSGKIALMEQIQHLRRNSGKVLRVDHTYNFVNPLAGYSFKQKKSVTRSFFGSLFGPLSGITFDHSQQTRSSSVPQNCSK